MRASIFLLAVAASGAAAQETPTTGVGRSVAVNAVPTIRSRGVQVQLEPAAWTRATLLLGFRGYVSNAGQFTRLPDGTVIREERLRALGVELRAYPLTLRTRTPSQRALPFLSAGAVAGQRDLEGNRCETREAATYVETVCTSLTRRILRLGATAAAGLRLLPSRLFMDVAGRVTWAGPGEPGSATTPEWRLNGEVAIGYTW